MRAGHYERLEVRGETCLVLLGVAEEGSAGSLDTYDGFCGKAQGPDVARLEGRAEQSAVLQCCPPGRLAGSPDLVAVSHPLVAQPAPERLRVELLGHQPRQPPAGSQQPGGFGQADSGI